MCGLNECGSVWVRVQVGVGVVAECVHVNWCEWFFWVGGALNTNYGYTV